MDHESPHAQLPHLRRQGVQVVDGLIPFAPQGRRARARRHYAQCAPTRQRPAAHRLGRAASDVVRGKAYSFVFIISSLLPTLLPLYLAHSTKK